MPKAPPLPDGSPCPDYPTGLKARGKRLWQELHATADFDGVPETRILAEEACFLSDEIERLRKIVRAAGRNTRVVGYNGQPVSMPEADDLRKNQNILLSILKSLRLPDEDDDKLTRSQIGKLGAGARWGR